jgi:hypothetical protein
MVKPDDRRYGTGRRAMTRARTTFTAGRVVAGLRVHADGGVGSLLPGAYAMSCTESASWPRSAKARRAEPRNELAPLRPPRGLAVPAPWSVRALVPRPRSTVLLGGAAAVTAMAVEVDGRRAQVSSRTGCCGRLPARRKAELLDHLAVEQ